MDFMEAIRLYRDTFNEGPPIYGMEEDKAIARIKEAVETGKKIVDGAEVNAPKGVCL